MTLEEEIKSLKETIKKEESKQHTNASKLAIALLLLSHLEEKYETCNNFGHPL